MRYDNSIHRSWSSMYLLLAFANLSTAWYIPPIMSSTTISEISTTANNLSLTSVFFKHVCHANLDAERKWARSETFEYVSKHRHLFLKLLNMSSSNKVSLCIYRSWCKSRFCNPKSARLFSLFLVSVCDALHYCHVAGELLFLFHLRAHMDN